MNVIEAMRSRRAVRSYTSRALDDATVRALLHAAVLAPTARNEQPWIFAVVQDRKQLGRWSDRAKRLLLDLPSPDAKTRQYNPLLADPKFNVFYDAGTLVVIGARERGPYTDADCWLAAENLMLAACDMGIGSCPVGFAVPLLNTREVKEEIHFPQAAVAVAPILLGYAREATPFVARAEPRITCWSR